jgi:SAM-dependent methyltransferase
MRLSDYFELWRVARRRSRSEQDYRVFQRFQAKLLFDHLARHGAEVRGRRILDLGSGVAGYSQALAEAGGHVIGLDLAQPRLVRQAGLAQLRASALSIPLATESLDLVFCASLIEHVAEPGRVLDEIERVLKPGGMAYVSFPPYYSPMGGHEYAPYHYLGEKAALRLVNHRRVLPGWVSAMHGASEQPQSFAGLYQGWGLYHMTIRKFGKLLRGTHLTLVNKSTRYLPVSFVRWPLVGEVLTWHAQFVLRK